MQRPTILLADSGSTKTDWILTSEDGDLYKRFNTNGLNPCVLPDRRILIILQEELLPQLSNIKIDLVRFYGAGCRGIAAERMSCCLTDVLGECHVTVESDLLGAARIVCRDKPGIVCILGTGSASCRYDGHDIVQQIPSLGYILGDEGSGAVLGRELIGYIYKGGADNKLIEAFRQRYGFSVDQIIESVYREPAPNRFLANLTHFINEHLYHSDMQKLVIEEFNRFFIRNICHYSVSSSEKVSSLYCVGSVAYVFRDQLSAVASRYGFHVAKIVRHPLDAM